MKINLLLVAMILSLTLTLSVGTALSQSGSKSKPAGSGSKSGSGSRGSGSQGSGTQEAAPETEEAKAFRLLGEQLIVNQKRIDYLFRTIPIGFPDRRKMHLDEIARLTKVNEQLKTSVFEKAKAAFSSSEQPSLQSVKILEKQLRSCLTPNDPEQNFSPEAALELAAMMTEKFPDAPALRQFEFVANYALERFENAAVAMAKLEKLTGSELTGPKSLLKDTMDKYQQELMIRRQEAGNDDLPEVLLQTTEGDIKVQLFENHAPNTVANFIHLVRDQKFYDGKIFHLVKPGEFAVTGSPNGDGMGNAGYRIAGECDGEKIRSHFRGTLSMMAGSKDTGGSQFFITQQPNPHTYDGRYTAFGRVIEGMDVVLKLHTIDRTAGVASASNASKIIHAEVLRARDHSYMPEKIAVNSGFPSFNADSTGSDTTGSDTKGSATQGSDTKEGMFQEGSDTKGSATKDDAFQDGSDTKDSMDDVSPIEDNVDAPGAFDLLLQGSDSNN